MKNQSFPKKLRHAISGIGFAWNGEQNFRTQVVLGAVTFVVFSIVRPAAFWWALIVLCVALVLVAELVNSAIEALTDHLHPDLHPVVGRVKDMLAGMVLVMSIGAAIVAMITLYATLAA
ncbi:diacylglycerol kinase [Arhodomonas aquaeolei]|uniref:diacylglycerol kinase n=1 Tax=Arhodomonas aquaeolei TaxID=2369 RepID=UPI00216838AB|nr:diacylglycerol kinase [Arhodomonas aquaeolei]MCS4504513.1 diacylglycerol kinase [Arhodomonas aquaeolei]